MSIAEKLTYLQTTKQLLKTEINKINNVLTDNSTFRSYPQELFNGYLDILNNGTDTLWNNLEKVSASGETPVLENVETAPIKMVLNGNTSQDTTNGKNALPYTEQTFNEEKNGVTFTGENGVYTISGTPEGSSATSTLYSLLEEYTIKEGDYLHLLNNAISSVVTFALRFTDGTSSAPALAPVNRILNLSNHVGKTVNKINLYCTAQYTGEKITLTPMILNNVSTYTEFEPYTGGQPSPSPDYPQQVKVVKGENVVSVSGKNLFDKDNQAKVQVNAEGTLRYGIIVNAPNKKVSVSGKKWSGYIAYKPLTNGVYGQWVNTNRDTTINVTDKLIIYSNGDTIKLDTYVDDLQIEISDIPTSYVPYSKTDYTINLGDIELCKINTYKDYFHKDSGKWYVHKEIGKGIYNLTRGGMTISNRKWFFFNKPSDSIDIGTYNTNAITEVAQIGDAQSTLDIFFSGNGGTALYAIVYQNAATIPTLAELQEKVNGKSYYYVLKTPTETEITNTTLIEQLEAISKAKSVKDKTYITQTNDELPFILDVEAIKEYSVE